MTAIRYADRVRCDYPDCESYADTGVDEGFAARKPAAGWVALGHWSLLVATPTGQNISDLCSLHASTPIDKLAAVFELKRKTNG